MGKEFFGVASFVLTIWTYGLYIRKMVQKKVRPHLFTFLPSGLVMSIVTLAQIKNGSSLAAWSSAATSMACFVIVILAPWYGETKCTWFDFISFIGSIVVTFFWLTTRNDLLAVIFSCIINTLCFLPTWRKIYLKPHTENSAIYHLSALRAGINILSVQNLILVNWLFPAYLVLHNIWLGVFRQFCDRKSMK